MPVFHVKDIKNSLVFSSTRIAGAAYYFENWNPVLRFTDIVVNTILSCIHI